MISVSYTHLALGRKPHKDGGKTSLKGTTLLALAMIHNIPEGLAVGIAFSSIDSTSLVGLAGAVSLSIGIAIQDFPEGLAVSFPLLKEGISCLLYTS